MTRINVVEPCTLCDQHLLAEHREITRIPNTINKGKYKLAGQPNEYTLGTGHVKFFYDKLAWLKNRYQKLHTECLSRGFNVKYIWPDSVPSELCGDYSPTREAQNTNTARILERWPTKARFYGKEI